MASCLCMFHFERYSILFDQMQSKSHDAEYLWSFYPNGRLVKIGLQIFVKFQCHRRHDLGLVKRGALLEWPRKVEGSRQCPQLGKVHFFSFYIWAMTGKSITITCSCVFVPSKRRELFQTFKKFLVNQQNSIIISHTARTIVSLGLSFILFFSQLNTNNAT